MKQILAIMFCMSVISSHSQVTIESSNLPIEGDTLITLGAIFLNEPDLENSGQDYYWVFDEEALQSTGFQTIVPCLPEDEAPFLYQLLFNNPFDPEYNADFAFGVDDFNILTIAFNDNYWFYQNNDDSYVSVGFATTINEIPLPTTLDPVDIIYELPLQYGDDYSGYSEMNIEIPTLGSYSLQQSRSYEVDGWGTLELWGEEYEVLRVKTEIEATDSIYVEFFQTGTAIDRPLAIEYKWMSPQFKVPVLQVNTSAGFITSVQTIATEEFIGISENSFNRLNLFPNPSNNIVNLVYSQNQKGTAKFYSSNGISLFTMQVNGNNTVNVSSWTPGEYFVVVEMENGQTLQSRIVVN